MNEHLFDSHITHFRFQCQAILGEIKYLDSKKWNLRKKYICYYNTIEFMIIWLMWFRFQFSVSFECRLANGFCLHLVNKLVGVFSILIIMIIKKNYNHFEFLWCVLCSSLFVITEIPIDMTITLLNRSPILIFM